MKPKYKHDCSKCVLVGVVSFPGPLLDGSAPIRNADLYCCGADAMTSVMGPSIIARFSSEGSDYASTPSTIIETHYLKFDSDKMSTSAPALIAAYYFAKAKGLLKSQKKAAR